VAEMQRLTAAAAAARIVNDRPLPLPAPGQLLALPEPAPTAAQDASIGADWAVHAGYDAQQAG
jgi:hypothetical protein